MHSLWEAPGNPVHDLRDLKLKQEDKVWLCLIESVFQFNHGGKRLHRGGWARKITRVQLQSERRSRKPSLKRNVQSISRWQDRVLEKEVPARCRMQVPVR